MVYLGLLCLILSISFIIFLFSLIFTVGFFGEKLPDKRRRW